MSSFRNLTIRRKLQFLVLFAIASLSTTLAFADVLLHRYGINGPHYNYVLERKDLVSEMSPPTILILEPYLILQELESETDKAAIEAGRLRFREAIRLHDERRDHYLKNAGLDDQLKKLIERDMHDPVVRFTAIAQEEYFPLLTGQPVSAMVAPMLTAANTLAPAISAAPPVTSAAAARPMPMATVRTTRPNRRPSSG